MGQFLMDVPTKDGMLYGNRRVEELVAGLGQVVLDLNNGNT
jgi:hypothetical protein